MYGLFSIHPFLCHGRDNFIKEEDWRKFIRKKRYDLMPFIIKYNINKFLFGLFYSFHGSVSKWNLKPNKIRLVCKSRTFIMLNFFLVSLIQSVCFVSDRIYMIYVGFRTTAKWWNLLCKCAWNLDPLVEFWHV